MAGAVKVVGLAALQGHLVQLGAEIDALDVMKDLAEQGARLASSFAPRRSGRLAASVRGGRARNSATVRAGSVAVPYAGVINYGWRKRNIQPAYFMERASGVLRPRIPTRLEIAINRLIAAKGLA